MRMYHEYVLIEKITLSSECIERVRAVESYRRDGTGYFNRDCAGHGWSSTFKSSGAFPQRFPRWPIIAVEPTRPLLATVAI